jgi:putative CocE/NonD family hydrolase
MLGVSYGAGISLLAAARDPRIKAVVAMSTWTDLAACFYPHDTTSIYSLGALLGEAQKAGHLSGQLTSVTNTLVRDADAGGAEMAKLSPPRSPASVINGLNKNHPAIMIANGFADSIISPQQLVSFYDKLTGPKRLELAAGDHGQPEYSGLLGTTNVTVTAARDWLDHYLDGAATATVKQDPVELQDVATRAWHSYPSWPAASTTLQLGPDGSVSTGAAQTWTASIAAGTDTVATSGPTQISSPYPYVAPKMTFTALDRAHAFVWTGPPVSGATLVTGLPRFTVDVRSSTGSATLFTYLYDVDAAGSASLMSVAPYTVTGASSPTPISLDLPPTSWTFAPGHRLAVVVDTVDGRWHSASAAGSTVTLSSSAAHPASLSLAIAG